MAMFASAPAYGGFEKCQGVHYLYVGSRSKRKALYWRTRAVVVHDRALQIAMEDAE